MMAALLSSGVLPPGGILAVLCWPFLVALLLCLLPPSFHEASSRAATLRSLSCAGAALTLVALLLTPSVEGFGAAMCGAVSLIPLLLPPGRDRVSGLLPFLVTGCVMLALTLRSVLAVIVLCGAASALLAWGEGRRIGQAQKVWSMVRVRLCGVVLGLLGEALLTAGPSAQTTLGAVLLAVGLCMTAGVGMLTVPGPDAALLDGAQRFAAVALMLRLSLHPMVQGVVLVAGMAGLGCVVIGKRKSFPLLPFFTALATIAAAQREEIGVLLLFLAVLGSLALAPRVASKGAIGTAIGTPLGEDRALRASLGLLLCACVAIGRASGTSVLAFLLLFLAIGLRGVRLAPIEGAIPPHADKIALVLEVLLFLGGVGGALLLGWHPALRWQP